MNDPSHAPEPSPPFEIGPELLGGYHAIGGYTREIPVSVERFFENLLDWEHLPWLHATTFGSVRLVARGRWWWSALVGTAREPEPTRPTSVVVDPSTWTYAVRNPTEIVHVRITPVADRQVTAEVTFHTARAPRNEATRRALFDLYHRQFVLLSEEDLAAMLFRQEALDRQARGDSEVGEGTDLGTPDALRARLPLLTTWRGGRFWVVADGAGFGVHGADCPHMLGPLPPADLAAGPGVRCPWHDYRFDARAGRSCDGHDLKLRRPFALVEREGRVIVSGRSHST